MSAACTALVAAVLPPAAAHGQTPVSTVLVTPDQASVGYELPRSGSSSIQTVAEPASGSLSITAHYDRFEVRYTPRSAFWSLGSDLVTLRFGLETRHLLFVAGLHGTVHHGEDFETGAAGGCPGALCINFLGASEVLAEAALSGSYGLRSGVSAALPSAAVFEIWRGDDGDQSSGSGGGGWGPPPGHFMPPEFDGLVIYRAMADNGAPAIEVELDQAASGEMSLRALFYSAVGTKVPTAWYPVGQGGEFLVDWWSEENQPTFMREGGGMLWIDGLHRETVRGLGDFARGVRHAFGVFPTAFTNQEYWLNHDDLRVSYAAAVELPADGVANSALVRLDDFEDGLAPWQVREDGNIFISHRALVGRYSLEVVPIAGTDTAAIDPSPKGETRLAVRLQLGVKSLRGLAGEEVAVLGEAASGGTDGGLSRWRVVLRHQGRGWYPVLQVLESGTYVDAQEALMGQVAYEFTEAVIEVQWWAAGADAANGRARLWIEGVLAAEATGLATGTAGVDEIHVGAWDATAGISGSFKVDNFAVMEVDAAKIDSGDL